MKKRVAQVDMTEGSIIAKLFYLSTPLVAGNILQTLYNLVDMFWVGRLGANAVAAVSIVFPTQWLLISIAMGITIAGSALVSQWTGARDHERANFVAAQTLTLITLVSVGISTVAYLARFGLLAFLGAKGALFQPTLAYVSVIVWSVPFTFLFFAFRSVLRGTGETLRPMYLVIASNLLNLVLDPVLILGVGPFPALGVAGAAWATLIARAAAAAVGVYLLFNGQMSILLRLGQLRPHWPTIRRLVRIGIPGGLDGGARSFSAVAMIAIVTRFGPTATAAYGIGVRVMSLVWTISGAIGQAVATGVGQNIGARQPRRAEQVVWAGVAQSFLLVGIGGILAVFFAPFIVQVFVHSRAVIDEGSLFLRITGWGFGFGGAIMVIQGAFRGAGKTGISMMLSVINRWVLRMGLAVLLGLWLVYGSTGLWWSLMLSDALAFAVGAVWVKRKDWSSSLVEAGPEGGADLKVGAGPDGESKGDGETKPVRAL